MVVAAKYLDVAMVVALFDPISGYILIAIIKLDEIRKRNQKNPGGRVLCLMFMYGFTQE